MKLHVVTSRGIHSVVLIKTDCSVFYFHDAKSFPLYHIGGSRYRPSGGSSDALGLESRASSGVRIICSSIHDCLCAQWGTTLESNVYNNVVAIKVVEVKQIFECLLSCYFPSPSFNTFQTIGTYKHAQPPIAITFKGLKNTYFPMVSMSLQNCVAS